VKASERFKTQDSEDCACIGSYGPMGQMYGRLAVLRVMNDDNDMNTLKLSL